MEKVPVTVWPAKLVCEALKIFHSLESGSIRLKFLTLSATHDLLVAFTGYPSCALIHNHFMCAFMHPYYQQRHL